jgi:L-glyceraldehyde 3-phosphate reductase
MMRRDFRPYRDEVVISTKAGYGMWPGPYGEWGSRKYLIASVDQSLSRLGVEYVDIFYSHRFDPETPLDETMAALDAIVRSGKALYVGLSSYSPAHTIEAMQILDELGTPAIVHQPSYSMLNRWIEKDLLQLAGETGFGLVLFSVLAQGLLTDKYLGGIPEGSRASRGDTLSARHLDEDRLRKVRGLNEIARARGQSLAQMAISWALRDPRTTSAVIGASSVEQLRDSLKALSNLDFTEDELRAIEQYATESGVDRWRASRAP